MTIKPLIKMTRPNAKFVVFKGLGRLYGGKNDQTLIYEGFMEATQFWIPHPQINLKVKGFGRSNGCRYETITRIELGDQPFTSQKPFLVSLAEHESEFLIDSVQYGTPDKINKVIAHVFNFFILDSYSISDINASKIKINLDFEDWEIELISTTRDSRKIDREISIGNILTHIVSVKRKNGRDFSFSQAEKLLKTLTYFLSFSRGGWVGIGHARGIDNNEIQCFESWEIGVITANQIVWRWASSEHVEDFKKAWIGFASSFRDEGLNKVFRFAINFYINANLEPVPDTGIVLAMIALEILASTINEKNEWIKADAFEKLASSDRIRLILAWSGISIKDLGYVKEVYDADNKTFPGTWTTGPEITTNLRNWIVHPTTENRNKLKDVPFHAISRAEKLTIWHLELVFLHIIKYDGVYIKRTLPGMISASERTQNVPWSAHSS
jgi:hypothetical protein